LRQLLLCIDELEGERRIARIVHCLTPTHGLHDPAPPFAVHFLPALVVPRVVPGLALPPYGPESHGGDDQDGEDGCHDHRIGSTTQKLKRS
jgi:hypothetical protein